jgi:hypothetical protein
LVRNGYTCPDCTEAKAEEWGIDEDAEYERERDLNEERKQ